MKKHGGICKGDVIVIPFPFSDLRHSKKRPALVIAELEGDDVVLCQITSSTRIDKYSIQLTDEFESGGLRVKSNIRPNKLFTADKSIILYSVGRLRKEKNEQVITKIMQIIQG